MNFKFHSIIHCGSSSNESSLCFGMRVRNGLLLKCNDDCLIAIRQHHHMMMAVIL